MTKAFVLGGTGMIGRHLVKYLLANNKYSTITLLSRRELSQNEFMDLPNRHKLNIQVIDFKQLAGVADLLVGHSIGFSCLGTTRSDAGSVDAFIQIDYQYNYDIACAYKKALDLGNMKGEFLMVSSAGSNASSWFLYPRTKGRLEKDVIALKFNKTSIFRPALLVFDGKRNQPRLLESWAVYIAKMLNLSTGAVRVEQVARAMVMVSESDREDLVTLYENNEIICFE